MRRSVTNPFGPQRTPTVAIVGAGMGGISAGVLLRKAGIATFTIYEAVRTGQRHVMGQPGSGRRSRRRLVHLLVPVQALRLDPHPHTPGRDPRLPRGDGPATSALTPHLDSVSASRAKWDNDRHVYRLTLTNSDTTESHVLISAVGFLDVPYYPDWPGLHNWEGPLLPHVPLGTRARPVQQDMAVSAPARPPRSSAPAPADAGKIAAVRTPAGLGAAEGRPRLRGQGAAAAPRPRCTTTVGSSSTRRRRSACGTWRVRPGPTPHAAEDGARAASPRRSPMDLTSPERWPPLPVIGQTHDLQLRLLSRV